MPNPPRTLLCLGDSNTWAGHWVDQTDAALVVRFPENPVDVLNAGLPSETLSGLSEDGHAGGAFPRPVLFERLERVLDSHRPDTVAACYGINDGIYLPLEESRFRAFRDGAVRLERMVAARGATLWWITPPPFGGKQFGERPGTDYDRVMAAYSDWLKKRFVKRVADSRTPLLRHLERRRRREPDYVLAGDGVHIHSFAHGFVARALLETLGLGPDRPPVLVDGPGAVHVAPPFPIDPATPPADLSGEDWVRRWSRVVVSFPDARDVRYRLRAGSTVLAIVDGARLRAGLDLSTLPLWSGPSRAARLFPKVVQRQRLLRDSWLFRTGHERPGMPTGKPIRQAIADAQALGVEIERLVHGPDSVVIVEPA